jgi:hypothetical protein
MNLITWIKLDHRLEPCHFDEIDNMIDNKWHGWNFYTWMKVDDMIGINNVNGQYWYRRKHDHVIDIDNMDETQFL